MLFVSVLLVMCCATYRHIYAYSITCSLLLVWALCATALHCYTALLLQAPGASGVTVDFGASVTQGNETCLRVLLYIQHTTISSIFDTLLDARSYCRGLAHAG
jgi:hypothetical protein